MQESLIVTCPRCSKAVEANLSERADFISKYGCDPCRMGDSEEIEAMPKPEPKQDPKARTPKTHKLPETPKGKANGKAGDPVRRALDKSLPTQPDLIDVGVEQTKKIPAIHNAAIDLKKIQRERTLLSNKETELRNNLEALMKHENIRRYNAEGVKVGYKTVKEKIVVEIEDDESDEDDE